MKSYKILSSVYARTTNDTNGNPRRGWFVSIVFTKNGGSEERQGFFFDEGYCSYAAIPKLIRQEVMENCIWCDVTISQYKEFKRTYTKSDSRAMTMGLTMGVEE